jgi:RNA polymerase sigma-70 factor, ECF subfamily
LDDASALRDVFVAELGPAGERLAGAGGSDLPERLADVLAHARRTWPGLTPDAHDFVRCLARGVQGHEDPAAALGQLHAADLYLARACVQGQPAALAAFDQQILRPLEPALAAIDPQPAFADEVRQVLRQRLLVAEPGQSGKLATYVGSGPLSAWVRVAAVRVGVELQRRVRHEIPLDAVLELRTSLPAPERDLLKGRFRDDFSRAFHEALAGLPNRERVLLRLYYQDGLTVQQMGAVYAVNASTISRWLTRARTGIVDGTRKALAARLAMAEPEIDSLLDLAQSLELSLGNFLKASAR